MNLNSWKGSRMDEVFSYLLDSTSHNQNYFGMDQILTNLF